MPKFKSPHKNLEHRNKILSGLIYLVLVLAGCLFLFILYHAHKITDARFQEKINYTDKILQDISIHYLWIIDNDSLEARFNDFFENDEEINFIEAIDTDANIVSVKKETLEDSLVSTIKLEKDKQFLGQLRVGYSTTKTYTLRSIIQWLMFFIFLLFSLIYALVFTYWRNDKKLSVFNATRYKSIFENISTPILEVSVTKPSSNDIRKTIDILKLNHSAKDFIKTLHPEKIILESNAITHIPKEIKYAIVEFDDHHKNSATFDINFNVLKTQYSVSISISKYTNIENNINKYLISIYDLTTLKNQVRSQQVMQAKINTMQRIESIGKLAGGIAHDFNNILSSIMGYIEHSRIDTPDKHHSYFNGIENAVTKAKEIVNQILFFSKENELEKTTTNLAEAVNDSLNLVRAGIPESVKINITIADDQALNVNLNAAQITQITMNLCTNSFHSMQDGFGEIALDVYKTNISEHQVPSDYPDAVAGEYCCLKITDNGCGIPNVHMNRIFDPYFTTKSIDKGSGLGLSVVYGIVVNGKGFISMHSVLNEGTCIYIYLPCVDLVEERIKAPELTFETSTSAKVIFLDDNEEVTSISLSLLKKIKHLAWGYHDPLEVLDLLKAQPTEFDVLISDVTMPNLSGIQLAKELRSNNINIPIILMSGYNSELSEKSMAKYNIHKLLKKPFSLNDLEQAIASALSNIDNSHNVKALK